MRLLTTFIKNKLIISRLDQTFDQNIGAEISDGNVWNNAVIEERRSIYNVAVFVSNSLILFVWKVFKIDFVRSRNHVQDQFFT